MGFVLSKEMLAREVARSFGCVSHQWDPSMPFWCKAKVAVRAELRWSPVSKVGRIYRNKVSLTVGIPGCYDGNRILLWFSAAVTISIWVSDWELFTQKYFVCGERFGHHPKERGCNLLFSLKILPPQSMPVVTPEWITANWSSTKLFPETTKDNCGSRKKCIILYAAYSRKDISEPEWHLYQCVHSLVSWTAWQGDTSLLCQNSWFIHLICVVWVGNTSIPCCHSFMLGILCMRQSFLLCITLSSQLFKERF